VGLVLGERVEDDHGFGWIVETVLDIFVAEHAREFGDIERAIFKSHTVGPVQPLCDGLHFACPAAVDHGVHAADQARANEHRALLPESERASVRQPLRPQFGLEPGRKLVGVSAAMVRGVVVMVSIAAGPPAITVAEEKLHCTPCCRPMQASVTAAGNGITGEPNVGFVVFVRKRLVEVQYLRATITREQREHFGEMVASTIRQIEAAQFPARSGIRFPQNGCLSCSHLGLCLGRQELVDSKLIRRPGGDLGWLDQLDY
jgi:hypothetical protein